MAIELNHVVPLYLEPDKIAGSGIWNREITLEKGRHYLVNAASGRGKTSFIHFLYGLRKDYSGDINIDGIPPAKSDAETLARMRREKVAIVFQDLRLFQSNTIWENLQVKNTLSSHLTETDIRNLAERLGIAGKLNQLAGKCSYGEQQRAAIIRSILQPFDYLLLDEPLSHLDDRNREKAMQLLLETAKAHGAAIILADLRESPLYQPDQIISL